MERGLRAMPRSGQRALRRTLEGEHREPQPARLCALRGYLRPMPLARRATAKAPERRLLRLAGRLSARRPPQ